MFRNLDAAALGVSGHQSEIIEMALTYGFGGLRVDIVELANRAKLHGMPYARRLLDSAKIRVGTFSLPLKLDSDDDQFKKALEKLAGYAEVAAELGCTRSTATIAPADDTRPYHENFEFHRRRLSDVCGALESAGVRLGIGFRAAEDLRKGKAFQFIHELDALRLLVNMVGASNIGILLDVWDLHISGGSPETVRGLTANQIVAVQLADLPADSIPSAELTEASRVLPDPEGEIDLPAYLAVLAEIGYDGPVTIYPARESFSTARRDPIVKKVGEAFKQIWQAAGLTPGGRLAVHVES